MEIKRTMKMEIEKSQIKKGDRLLISGEEWKVLAQAGNKALLWKCTNVFTSMFDKAGETDYLKSNIRRFLRGTYPNMVPKALREAITEDGFFFLTKGEIEVYMPNEADRIAVDEYGQTTWYWTASSYPTTMSVWRRRAGSGFKEAVWRKNKTWKTGSRNS